MSELTDRLDEFIDKTITVPQEFTITDDKLADWAVRKILKRQQNIAEANEAANERIEAVKAWLTQIESDNDSTYLLEKLREYAITKLDGKVKTLKLISGNISFRSVNPKFYIAGSEVKNDNELLIKYVETNEPDLIETKNTVKWGDFKKTLVVASDGKVINSDGEVLHFITGIEQPDNIAVKERK